MGKWFFKERFSIFDLIVILIVIQIIDWILSHLAWT